MFLTKEDEAMVRKRHSAEEIVAKLRQAIVRRLRLRSNVGSALYVLS